MDLSYFEMLKGARNIINVSAGIRKGEQLLIVTDTNKFEVAELIALAAQEKEINYSIAIMAVREPGEEPPKPIAAAMKEADIIIAPTTQSLYHNHATLAARDAGARFIAMSGILPEIMASPATRFNFQSFQSVVNKVAEIYRKAERIKVTSPSGTNIEASIRGRRVNVDGGLLSKGHPIGGTGGSQVRTIVKQLRGECGDTQVENAKIGLVQNVGGVGTYANVIIFGRE